MDEAQRAQFDFIRARQTLAELGPSGPWWKRLPGLCAHESVRCVHGDEIVARRFRRRVCLTCGRSLKGPLPEVCFFTDKPH